MAELAVLAGVGHELFSYNRENFKFDREQQQKREYAGQNMRIAQFELYREDIRDLVELTVGKMDNYMIINALLLGFSIILMTEGRPKSGFSKPWLLWLFEINNVGAFMYFTLSIWLALHASIAAHSFGVRLLTQYVRLPVPNKKQIDAAQWKFSDYEAESFSTMFRIPVVQQMEKMNATMGDANTDDTTRAVALAKSQNAASERAAAEAANQTAQVAGGPASDPYDKMLSSPAQMLQHVTLYREVQGNWQAYDGYARVCMALGMNQLCHALAYYTENTYIEENALAPPAIACVMIFAFSAWLLCRLDLYVAKGTLRFAGFLLLFPPLLSLVVISVIKIGSVPEDTKKLVEQILVPIIFFTHILWILFLVWVAKADSEGAVRLPARFRSVLYLDIFGWIGRKSDNADQQEEAGTTAGRGGGGGGTAAGTSAQAALRTPLLGEEPSIAAVAQLAQGQSPRSYGQPSGVSVGQANADGSTYSLGDGNVSMTSGGSAHSTRQQTQNYSISSVEAPGSRGVSMPGGVSMGGLQGSPDLPPNLRQGLSEACWVAQGTARAAVALWEHEGVQDLLKDDKNGEPLIAKIKDNRQDFDKLVAQLEQLKPEGQPTFGRVEGTLDQNSGRIWLELQWEVSGQWWPYFYEPVSKKTLWTKPTGSDVTVMELSDTDLLLGDFLEKVGTLANYGPAFRPSQAPESVQRPSADFGPAALWGTEHTYKVGNEGDESKFEGRVMMIPRGMTESVTTAVQMISNGAFPCPEGFCVVYSASSDGFFMLHRSDMAAAARFKFEPLEEGSFVEQENAPQNLDASMFPKRQGSMMPVQERRAQFAQGGAATQSGGDVGAQESRYGGGEALQLAQGDFVQQNFFSDNAAVGTSFHPSRRQKDLGRAEKMPTRPPGQMPWRTFFQGSVVLVLLWIAGTIWVIIDLDLELKIPYNRNVTVPEAHHEPEKVTTSEPEKAEHFGDFDDSKEGGFASLSAPSVSGSSSWMRSFWRFLAWTQPVPGWGVQEADIFRKKTGLKWGAEIMFDGDWPHAHFRLRDVACHPRLGLSRVLVAERYGVHELTFSPGQETATRPILTECLSQDKAFVAGGLGSMSLSCSTAGDCDVVLFSAAGLGALRCPLPLGAGGQNASEPTRVALHGGEAFRAVAAGENGAAWAVDGEAIVQLGARSPTTNDELVPKMEVARNKQIKHVTRLHALGDDAVMGLDSRGFLYSWALDGSLPRSYVLPHGSTEWTGVCSSGDKVYLAGRHKGGGPASVWRFSAHDGLWAPTPSTSTKL